MLELKGIDVSAWQGNIDWAKVKADGIQFAIIRVAAGTNIDRYFVNNIVSAIKNNISCGVYVYSYASTPEMAKEEAEVAIKAISPYQISYPVVFDIEDKVQHNLTNSQRTDIVEAFCSVVKAAGYKPGVYSSLSWFNTMFDLNRLKDYDKWVAQWGPSKCSFKGDNLALWQHSDSGSVSGIIGNVDLNICYKDYLNSETKTPDAKPTPVPQNKKPVQSSSAPNQTTIKAGTKLSLNGVPLFSSATSKTPASVLKGTYWVYDDQVISSRVRITNKAENVGKLPASNYVTGYIKQSDAR